MIIYTFNFWLPSNLFYFNFTDFVFCLGCRIFWLCRTTRHRRMLTPQFQLRSRKKDVVIIARPDEFEKKIHARNEGEDDSQGLSPLLLPSRRACLRFFFLAATDMSPNENKRKPLIRSRAWILTPFFFFKGRNNRTMHFSFVCFISLISLKKYFCLRKKLEK